MARFSSSKVVARSLILTREPRSFSCSVPEEEEEEEGGVRGRGRRGRRGEGEKVEEEEEKEKRRRGNKRLVTQCLTYHA